jgi:hypothetical protein
MTTRQSVGARAHNRAPGTGLMLLFAQKVSGENLGFWPALLDVAERVVC